MDTFKNPFSPGAGTQPPELAGRQDIIDEAVMTLRRVQNGKSFRSLILTGLRGTGKTVLLNRIKGEARALRCQTLFVEADQDRSLAQSILHGVRKILLEFDQESTSRKVKRALAVLKSVSLTIGFATLQLDIEPLRGTGDSGDFETDLTELLMALGQAAQSQETSVVIIIDEIQYLKKDRLASLITAIHRATQEALPVALFGGGLPQLRGHFGNARSYTERMFLFEKIGSLKRADAQKAVETPVRREGASISPEALDNIITQSEGYPYFLQIWGYHAWNQGSDNRIEPEAVKAAAQTAIAELDRGFFRMRLDRLTPTEKDYLSAMAKLGAGPHKSSDIARRMGREASSVAPLRGGLIDKGMIYSPAHGDTAFTVPMFDAFMKRTGSL